MKIQNPVMISVDDLVPNAGNPNSMTEKQLNKLCEQILEYGFTEPLMVGGAGADGKYEIISGHHRHKAARELGMSEVPCIVYEDWDEKKREVAMIRMNIVKGRLNPEKFMKLFNGYANEYGESVAKDLMGFADEGAFEEIKKQMKKGLPPEVKQKIEKMEKDKEIESVEELTQVVSEIMSEHGDTVPCDFVHFKHGGKGHIMQRTDDALWSEIRKFYQAVEAHNLDSVPVLKLIFKDWEDIVLRRRHRKKDGDTEDE